MTLRLPRQSLLPAVLQLVLLSTTFSSALSAHAEVMDDIDMRKEGHNAVLAIHLSTPVSLVRFTRSRSNDLTQAFYRVRANLASPPDYVTGERRVVEAAGLPVITIEDEPVHAGVLDDPDRRLVIALGQAASFKVRAGAGDRTIEVVLEGLGDRVKANATFGRLTPAALSPGQNYVIALLRSPTPQLDMNLPVPQTLQQYQLFTSRRLVDGKQVHELDLGYFATLAEAETALRQVTQRYPQSVIVRITPEAPIQGIDSEPLPLKDASTLQSADVQAQSLLEKGRQLFEQHQFDEALVTLNQALELPVSARTPETHELLGDVLAAMGDKDRAEAEYVAYLKQYTDGPGVPRVRDKLASLHPTELRPADNLASPPKPEVVQSTTGSISQYYYGGKLTSEQRAQRLVEGTPLTADEVANNSKLPLTQDAQKLLSTNADATWKSRDTEREMKFVVRDQFDYNLLSRAQLRDKSRYRNRLTAAYFDYMGLSATRLRGRFGRQNAAWGGEGRFDGASGSYAFWPKWKVSGLAGTPVDGVADSHRYFIGTSLDADALTPNFGASVFALQRMIDGEVDRRAVGTDLRWFSGGSSLMGSVDYDTLYRKLNAASLQGMVLTENNATVNFLSERRALIPVSLSQTLFFQYPDLLNNGIQPRTISDLKAFYTTDQLRQFVRSNASYFSHTMVSVTVPVSTQWQLGSDYHINNVGAIAPNDAIGNTGQPATGPIRSLGLQAIGTNLYSARDTHVFSLNGSRGRLNHSKQFNYNNMTALDAQWEIDPGFHWVRSVTLDNTGALQSSTVAWGPGIRASFKPRPSVTLESNLTLDRTTTVNISSVGTTGDTATTSKSNLLTYYLGYRYEY